MNGWNTIKKVWKIILLFNWVIFRFQLNFQKGELRKESHLSTWSIKPSSGANRKEDEWFPRESPPKDHQFFSSLEQVPPLSISYQKPCLKTLSLAMLRNNTQSHPEKKWQTLSPISWWYSICNVKIYICIYMHYLPLRIENNLMVNMWMFSHPSMNINPSLLKRQGPISVALYHFVGY